MSKPQAALPPAILLMGPTASGKTDLAVELTEQLPVDLVSVDSALVYRGMNIGTAKPDAATLARAPHRLIDICDPADAYSAARFCDDALREMAEITAAGRIPLLVGGTMLYFRALQQGLADMPEADPVVRSQLEQEMAQQGLAALHRRLAEVDPVAAERIHPNDPQRTLRALEVWQLTGKPLSLLQAEGSERAMPYRAIKLVRAPLQREILHQRIERRFRAMLEQGFEDEVRTLWARGDLTADLPSMRAVGYRQMLAYILGEDDFDAMVEKGIAATRQLAKRQMTWLRSEVNCFWLDEADGNVAAQALYRVRRDLR